MFIIIAVIIGIYTYSRSIDYFTGPSIVLTCPRSGATTTDPYVEIRGHAERIAKLRLNQRPIFTDDDGVFTESLLLMPGYNILTLEADDIFGRNIKENIELVYLPSPQPKIPLETAETESDLNIDNNLLEADN
jgi:hypothetical protein